VYRRADELTQLEMDILGACLGVAVRGEPELHGFAIAKRIADASRSRRLTAQGTLYQSLGRLLARGLLAARWEDAHVAADEGRPRRRYYRLTAEGQAAATATGPALAATRRPGIAGA
jgi:DNA-binding PadR family transcriptional regulator